MPGGNDPERPAGSRPSGQTVPDPAAGHHSRNCLPNELRALLRRQPATPAQPLSPRPTVRPPPILRRRTAPTTASPAAAAPSAAADSGTGVNVRNTSFPWVVRLNVLPR